MRADTRYAAKYMLKSHDLAMNKTFLDLVFNEAKVMSQLDHPNLVRLYEFSDKGVLAKRSGKNIPILYLIFDLITGGELFDYVAISGRFSDRLARHYFRQLVDALEFMHSRGYAHRDVKAENVLLDSNYTLKLADFGFSAAMAGKDGSGKMHTYKGTLGYMAPEIHQGAAYTGDKVDLFAAGVLLFIMVTGHPPFKKAVAGDPYYKMFCQQNDLFWTNMSKGKPPGTLSPALRSLLNGLLAYNPALRPTVEAIRAHPWYNGPPMTPAEIALEFAGRRARLETEWRAKAATAMAHKREEAKKTGMGTGYSPYVPPGTNSGTADVASEASKKFMAEYKVPHHAHL